MCHATPSALLSALKRAPWLEAKAAEQYVGAPGVGHEWTDEDPPVLGCRHIQLPRRPEWELRMPIDQEAAPSFDYQVRVGAIGTLLSYSDLAPFLDEMSKRHVSVNADVSSYEPPAAGFTEIALSITVVAAGGGVIYLKSFLETWAAEDAKAIRSQLSRFSELGWRGAHGRRFVPFTITLGPISFYFHEKLDEDAMLERTRAATALVQSLPDEAFECNPRESGYGLWWDRNRREWRGYIGTWGGEHCSPEGVLSEEPGDMICHEF